MASVPLDGTGIVFAVKAQVYEDYKDYWEILPILGFIIKN